MDIIKSIMQKYGMVDEWEKYNKIIEPDNSEIKRKVELYNKINKLEKEKIMFIAGTISDESLNKLNAEIARLKDIYTGII